MPEDIFRKNIETLRQNYGGIASKVLKADDLPIYTGTVTAKTGSLLPVLHSGLSLHSKYNPEKEAEKLFDGSENFVLFCGLGSGIHIRHFLKVFPLNSCAVCESDYPALKSLLHFIDFCSLISNKRVFFLPSLEDKEFTKAFIQTYVPILHGNLTVKLLRPWELFFKGASSLLKEKIGEALPSIKTDTATQACFGKIWMKNIFCNLKLAAEINPAMPKKDNNLTAFVAGAGPSLEKSLKKLKISRAKYVIFSTDTALPVLTANNIIPDFFVSIDPQNISYAHTFFPISKEIIGIFDLCSNPICARRFLKNGNQIIFTVGSHTFAVYAGFFSPFPHAGTQWGTVSITAYDAAKALGFKNIEYAGFDFAYTYGKAYASGTYLSKLYEACALKTDPIETLFVHLIFRSNTGVRKDGSSFTYTTELLNEYKKQFTSYEYNGNGWTNNCFARFPYERFIEKLKHDIKLKSPEIQNAILPYLAWKRAKEKSTNFFDLELVLKEILLYNAPQ